MIETAISAFCNDTSKENLVSLLMALCEISVFVPFTIVSGNALHMEADLLVNSSNVSHCPVFTEKKEIPEDYQQSFIWKKQPFLDCVDLALEQDVSLVLNAYTQNIVLPKDLLKIVNSIKKTEV